MLRALHFLQDEVERLLELVEKNDLTRLQFSRCVSGYRVRDDVVSLEQLKRSERHMCAIPIVSEQNFPTVRREVLNVCNIRLCPPQEVFVVHSSEFIPNRDEACTRQMGMVRLNTRFTINQHFSVSVTLSFENENGWCGFAFRTYAGENCDTFQPRNVRQTGVSVSFMSHIPLSCG